MMKRRTLLKGLAAASLCGGAATLGSLTAPADPKKDITLNLVLHGLFVLQFTKDDIQLMTPYVPMHRYLAGRWDPKDLNPICPESQPFTLTGVKKLKPYDPTKLTRGLVLSRTQQNFNIDIEHAYLTITLPWPQDIKLLRFAKPNPITGISNIFADPPLNNVKELSLCQVLIYPVESLQNLGLTGTNWRPKTLSPNSNTINLHLWAEPDHQRTLPSHAVEAYQLLGKLLPPLSFKLATADVKSYRDKDPGVTGMQPEEEMGLSEWIHRGEGTEGSNCGCVTVVD